MSRCKKASRADHIDQISNLPSDLIDSILQYLPIQDLIKTSILSRDWRYKWASVPQLEFGNNFFEKCKHLEYLETSSVITELLSLHNGPIHKCILYIPSNYPVKIECLNEWIMLLSRKGIKFLELSSLQTDPLQTPFNIFSCQGLAHLELNNFKLSSVPNFCGFKNLVTLHLSDIRFESNALESLMFGCPSLVWLTIAYCSGIECINICSPTFKALHVQGDQVIKSICLEKAKNMTDLSLMVDEPGDDFESDTVSNLIKGLSKIESICLGEGYIKIFSVGILPERLQRSLNCLKYLDLFGVNFNETRELLFVISLLESSPNLEKLSIESYSDGMDVGLPHTLEKSKYNSCCLTELLTVHIIVNNACKNTLNFIRFLLANSPSLEILSFKIALGQDHYSISSIRRELRQMARASLKVNIEFNYEEFNDK